MSVVPAVRPETRPAARTAAQADRHARALAALQTAEQSMVRRTRTLTAGTVPERPSASTAPAGPADLADSAGPAAAPAALPARPVHPALASLLPGGGLPTGGVLAVQGSTSLLLGLLAAPSREGAWVAFVGAPDVGLLAAADAGICLERTAVVPTPGPDAPAVLAALLDGMDVVVTGPQVALLPADRRRLAARTRRRDAVLVATERWPGAHVVLDARGGRWSGVDSGAGWLRQRTLSVLRTGRGSAARPVEIEVEVPLGPDAPLPQQADLAAAETLPARRLRVA